MFFRKSYDIIERMDGQSEEFNQKDEAEKRGEYKKQNALLAFIYDVLRGVGIGIAFIIPGFSGGSVAALLGVYERLVEAIADIFKHFKKSIVTLLPILLGMTIGVAALILPIQWGLSHYPIPTVTLFVGLALGGIPSVAEKLKGAKFTFKYALAFLIPLCAAGALCGLSFLNAGEVKLFELNAGGYFLLILVGAVGSCALVVPGISGSMLLLIFGYYNPLVELVTKNLLKGVRVGVSFAVLGCFAVGVVAGFFAISVLMKTLLKKYPKGTFFSILGFIVGSIPAVYLSTIQEANSFETATSLSALYSSPWYWVVTAIFLLLGIALSFGFWFFSKKRNKKEIKTP